MNVPKDVTQASESLSKQINEFCTPAYALDDDDNSGPKWVLYVVADSKPNNLPKKHLGFKVFFRHTPVLCCDMKE